MTEGPGAQARDAVCRRAAELAPGSSVDELLTLADAVCKVTLGPQGGVLSTDYREASETDYRYTAEYRDAPSERRAGFAAGDHVNGRAS